MIRFFKSRRPGPTDLTFEEKNSSDYIYHPKDPGKLQDFIDREYKSKGELQGMKQFKKWWDKHRAFKYSHPWQFGRGKNFAREEDEEIWRAALEWVKSHSELYSIIPDVNKELYMISANDIKEELGNG